MLNRCIIYNILGGEFRESRGKLSTLRRPASIEFYQPRHTLVSLDLILTLTSTYNCHLGNININIQLSPR